MQMNKKIILLGEGETEKKILKALKIPGRFQQFNIWQRSISKLLPALGGAHLWLYVDTDKADNLQEFQRFIDNIALLKKSKFTFVVHLQVRHLEDELARACERCIYQGFAVNQGSSELKDKIIQCRNLEQKLSDLHMDKNKLWRQSHIKCDEIVEAYREPKVIK